MEQFVLEIHRYTIHNTSVMDSTVLGGEGKCQVVRSFNLFQKSAVSSPTSRDSERLLSKPPGCPSFRAQHKCRVSSEWCTASPQLVNCIAGVLKEEEQECERREKQERTKEGDRDR